MKSMLALSKAKGEPRRKSKSPYHLRARTIALLSGAFAADSKCYEDKDREYGNRHPRDRNVMEFEDAPHGTFVGGIAWYERPLGEHLQEVLVQGYGRPDERKCEDVIGEFG